mgnify:CR=1 FL=1
MHNGNIVDASVLAGQASNTISIGDGTYTETITYDGDGCTFTSTSEDRTAVIVTQSSGATFRLAKGSTGNVFKHLTIQNTDNTQNDAGIYGAQGGSGDKASFTVEDCIFDWMGQVGRQWIWWLLYYEKLHYGS